MREAHLKGTGFGLGRRRWAPSLLFYNGGRLGTMVDFGWLQCRDGSRDMWRFGGAGFVVSSVVCGFGHRTGCCFWKHFGVKEAH